MLTFTVLNLLFVVFLTMALKYFSFYNSLHYFGFIKRVDKGYFNTVKDLET